MIEGRRRDLFDALEDAIRLYRDSSGIDLSSVNAYSIERVREYLANDEILKRFAKSAADAGTSRNRITEPWMALGEQRLFALTCTYPDSLRLFPAIAAQEHAAACAFLSASMMLAQTYLWTKEVFDTIKDAPLPPHVISSDLLPFPWTYHSYEVAYGGIATNAAIEIDDPELDWTLIVHHPSMARVYLGCGSAANRTGKYNVLAAALPYEKRFPDDIPLEGREAARQLLSMLAFLNSPYTAVDARRLPRQWRRDKRAAIQSADQDREIHVVRLRPEARDAVEAYNAESRTFKHRWWVAGHFRSQWYASERAHKMIWIAPHLKGPDGAPMVDRVYAVVR